MENRMIAGGRMAIMLTAIAIAAFMDGLDGSIVSIVLPDIGRSLNVDTDTSSWVTIIYFLVLSALIIPFARISADIGPRRVLAVGFAVFTIGSLFCGLVSSFYPMIATRALQAAGAAAMAAAGPMCCTSHLPPNKLAFGLTLVTIGSSLGFALGPVVGGAIVSGMDWHWIFLINIPVGAAAVPMILWAIPKGAEKGGRPRIADMRGCVLLCAGIVLQVFAIETFTDSSMRYLALLCLVLGIVILALFGIYEKHASEPLLEVSLFGRFPFLSVFLCLMFVNMQYMGALYLIPFFGEIALGKTALGIGWFLLVAAIVTAIVGLPISNWSDRTGNRRWFCIAAGIQASLAFLLYGLLAHDMTDTTLFAVCVIQGLGWGFVGGPMASRLIENAGDQRDMASALMNEAFYIGGAIGTALTAMLFAIWSGSDGIAIGELSQDVFLSGFVPAMFVQAQISGVVAVLSFLLKERKD